MEITIERLGVVVTIGAALFSAVFFLLNRIIKWRNRGVKESPEMQLVKQDITEMKGQLDRLEQAFKNKKDNDEQSRQRFEKDIEKIQDRFNEFVQDIFKLFRNKTQ